jgi:hypothetical protein
MRTRRIATAACSLLAVSFLASCGEDGDGDPDADGTPTATASPSPSESAAGTPSPSPSPEPPEDDTTKLTTRGLSVGGWPTVAYAVAEDPADPAGPWALAQSGGAIRLTVTGVQGVATLGAGAVVLVDDGNDSAAVVVDGAGQEVRREESRGYRLARTPDGAVVAWLARDQTTTVLGADGTRLSLPKVAEAGEIGAVVGGDNCPEVDADGYGCTAYLNGEQAAEVFLADSHGMSGLLGGPLIRVADAAADRRLAGLTSVDDLGSCSGVVAEDPEPVWETCDHTLTRFSPDGTRILGTDAYLDGFGQRSVVFLDAADGTVLHQFLSRGRGATVIQTAWEDSAHVLAVVYERGRWSIVRLGVDGSAELALDPVAASDLERPFVLAEG